MAVDPNAPVYAQIGDFAAFGISENAIQGYDPTKVSKALAAASRTMDGYLRPQFTLPLLAWTDDMKRACCIIAVWDILSGRGYNPESGSDVNVRDRYYTIMGDPSKPGSGWLPGVAAGRIIPSVTDSSSGGAIGRPSARPLMVSSSQRGFSSRGTSGPAGRFQGD